MDIKSVTKDYVQCASNDAVTAPNNGSWISAYAIYLGATTIVNGSWLQTLCYQLGITTPVNSSWVIALANYYGVTQPVNGSWWYGIADEACNGVTLAPIANFSGSPLTIEQGDIVDFTDLSTVPAGGSAITSWAWTFTDGVPATSTAQNPTGITYSNLGQFAVSLGATNAEGTGNKTVQNYITVLSALIWDTVDVDWNLEESNWKTAVAPAAPTWAQNGNTVNGSSQTFTGTTEANHQVILVANSVTYTDIADGAGAWSIDVTGLPAGVSPGTNVPVAITARDVTTGLTSPTLNGSVDVVVSTTTLTFLLNTQWSLEWYFSGIQVEEEVTPGVWQAVEYNGNPTWNGTTSPIAYKTQPYASSGGIPTGYSAANIISYQNDDNQGAIPTPRTIDVNIGGSYRIVGVARNNATTNYGRFSTYIVNNQDGTNLLPLYDGDDSDYTTGTVQQTFTPTV